MSTTWRRVVPALLTLLVLGASACGDSDTDGSDAADDTPSNGEEFVGTVEGTDAFAAVVVARADDGTSQAVVYVCDGDAELSEWFGASVEDPARLDLANAEGAAVSLSLDGGVYSGTFTGEDGVEHSVATQLAEGAAGLYRLVGDEVDANDVWGAWIVDNDGDERGAFRVRGTFRRTPRFSFPTLSFDEADSLFGKRTSFTVARVTTSAGIIAPNNIVAPNNISTGGSGGEDR